MHCTVDVFPTRSGLKPDLDDGCSAWSTTHPRFEKHTAPALPFRVAELPRFRVEFRVKAPGATQYIHVCDATRAYWAEAASGEESVVFTASPDNHVDLVSTYGVREFDGRAHQRRAGTRFACRLQYMNRIHENCARWAHQSAVDC